MAWGKAGSGTLDSSNNELTVTGITKNDLGNQIIVHATGGSGTLTDWKGRVGNGSFDTSNAYGTRENQNGNSNNDRNGASTFNSGLTGYGVANANSLHVVYFSNFDGSQKFFIEKAVLSNGTGTTAPNRYNNYYKHHVTGNAGQIDQFEYINSSGQTYDTDSNLTALGSDLTPAAAIPAIPSLMPSLQSPSVGGWKEVARTTLDSASSTLDVSSIPDKRYYMVLFDFKRAGTSQNYIRLNGSTSDYIRSYRPNNGSTSNSSTENGLYFTGNSSSVQNFAVWYISNKSGEEPLLLMNDYVEASTTGSGTAPDKQETVGKWTGTDVIDQITAGTTNANYASDSEMVILGWDPTDTHTDNFWEELASADLSSGNAQELDSGVFTAKKYLWIQGYFTYGSGSHISPTFRVGKDTIDTAGNYATRYSSSSNENPTPVINNDKMNYCYAGGADTVPTFVNIFIINNDGQQKISMSHATDSSSSIDFENDVGKWDITSGQINRVNFLIGTGNGGTKSTMKVWGHD